MDTIADGMIELDSPPARRLGFTSDLFAGYLWREGDRIMISLITSLQPGQGNFSRLMAAIESEGYRVAVPTPSGRMAALLEHRGFVPHWEQFIVDDEIFDAVEVWMKP
jgi:hypothetical protein